MSAISIQRIAKTYRGGVRALDDLALEVPEGEIFGLLGPNGAGKSTLVKALLTLVRPDICKGTLLGEAVGSRSVLRRVGYLPEHVQFPDYLTGAQVVDYVGAMAKVPGDERRQRGAALLEQVGMAADADRPMRTYSKGMKQRIGIAQALVNDPQMVFLDEPTDGVDPMGRREIRDLLARMREDGRTVFVNSHLLGEVEMIADRVAILVGGRVIREGSVDELTADGGKRFAIAFPGDLAADGRAARLVTEMGGNAESTKGWSKIEVPAEEPAGIQPLIDALRAEDLAISMVKEVRSSLEDLFIDSVAEEEAR